jgi:hypothetical integral membrane protein (TIGR02206 family)
MDLSGFFYDYKNVPAGLGIDYFSTPHLAWLGSILLIIIVTAFAYRAMRPKTRVTFKKGFAAFIVGAEILRQVYYIALGRYYLEYLPFHLCGLTEMTIFIYAYTNNKIAKESLYALGIIGAVMALTFADWLMLPLFNFQSIHSFLMHGLLIAFIVMLVFSGELKPSVKNLPKVFMIHFVICVALFFFNKAFDTNFFFMNYPSPGSPLVIFEEMFGNPGYVFFTIVLVFVVWIVEYLPWLIFGKVKKNYKYSYKNVKNPKY